MENALSVPILAPNSGFVNALQPSVDSVFLSDCSPRDKPWDDHRFQADRVAIIYSVEPDFHRLAGRISLCSAELGFAWTPDRDDPNCSSLKLRVARFCRVRYCPVCQWRRSLMWLARFYAAFPSVQEKYPTSRFLFLTLTCRNVPILELRAALADLNKSWHRFVKRGDFSPVQGWIRTTEVTRSEDDTAHPHFHCLLMVPSGYFKKSYVSQDRWVQLWKEALRVDYSPVVDVRAVKGDLSHAVRETLKYSIKPTDMMAHVDWFLEATRQLHKLRFVASGGALKNLLKEKDEEKDEDLMLLGEAGGGDEEPSLFFDWDKPASRYRRARGGLSGGRPPVCM